MQWDIALAGLIVGCVIGLTGMMRRMALVVPEFSVGAALREQFCMRAALDGATA